MEDSRLMANGVYVASDDGEETEPLLRKPLSKINWPKIVRGVGTAICIVLIVASWVTMAQSLQEVGNTYKKPFFQTYLIHSFYTCLYIGWKLWKEFPGNFSCNRVGEGTLTNFRYYAISTGVLTIIQFLSGSMWYLSLPRTSISANTAIYQSSSALVFIFSIFILGERVTLLKILSVCLTVTGVTLVSVFSNMQDDQPPFSNGTQWDVGVSSARGDQLAAAKEDKERSTPLGYVYLTLSTLFYAMIEVGFKKFAAKQDDPAPIQNGIRGLGYMGVHTLFWMWPLLIILHFTGLETFELPDLKIFSTLMLNVLLDLVFNGALFVCIALSSPLIASIGAVLVIPASVVVDWLVNNHILPWEGILGTLTILAGFFTLIFTEFWETWYWQRRDVTNTIERTDIAAVSGTNTKLKNRKNTTMTHLLHYII